MKTITLVRHAKVNGEPALYGATDIGISIEEQQNTLNCLLSIYQKQPITKIISSPLQRCLCAATLFSKKTQVPLETNVLAKEMNFGCFDGLPYSSPDYDWETLEKFYQSLRSNALPEGEPFDLFLERGKELFNQIKELNEYHILLMTHGGVIKLLLGLLSNDTNWEKIFSETRVDNLNHFQIIFSENSGWLLSQPQH